MKFNLFLAAFLLFVTSNARAQLTNDFYITTKQDTVYGEFGSNKYGRITFKLNGKKSTLDPRNTYRVYDAEKEDHVRAFLYSKLYRQDRRFRSKNVQD